jgi:phage terminase large subunit GpA-like protein
MCSDLRDVHAPAPYRARAVQFPLRRDADRFRQLITERVVARWRGRPIRASQRTRDFKRNEALDTLVSGLAALCHDDHVGLDTQARPRHFRLVRNIRRLIKRAILGTVNPVLELELELVW